MHQDDERLIWEYLDGFMTHEEAISFLKRAENDPELRSGIEWAAQLDEDISKQATYSLSPEVRLAITQKMATKSREKSTSSNWFSSGLKYFTLFNILIFLAGALLLFVPLRAADASRSDAWAVYFQVLNAPIVQTFFILMIGFFGLLWFDHYLKNKDHGKLTTPV